MGGELKQPSLARQRPGDTWRFLRPFVSPGFWKLNLRTLQLKRSFRQRGDRAYTEYLKYYYSRTLNPYYETIEDKWFVIRPVMIEMADLKKGERVLDLGTGLGFQAAAFASAGYPTLGIDFVLDRIGLARGHHNLGNLQWAVADAARLPFPQNSFEVVAVSLALHDMPVSALRIALSEIRRVARRRAVIAEPRLDGHPLLRPFYRSIATLLDESIYMQEFLDADLPALFQEAGLHLSSWKACVQNTLAVYACEVETSM